LGIRERIELGFERWGHLTVQHPWAAIVVTLLIAGALSIQILWLGTDNSMEALLHDDDPAMVLYNQFRDQFGRDEYVLVAIKPANVFDLAFLNKLRAFHTELENEVPYLDEIISLVNARHTYGSEKELIVEDLLEEWPQDAADVAEVKKRVLSNPIYVNTLISEDAGFTTLTIKPLTHSSISDDQDVLTGFEAGTVADDDLGSPDYITEEELMALVDAVREVTARYESADFRTYLAGGPVMENRINEQMEIDVGKFTLAACALVLVVLYTVFRRISGVILPIVIVGLALSSTVGLMALLGIPFSMTTGILPPFLLTVGVCSSVHILVIFYQQLGKGASREEAIVFSLGHCGVAVMMASLTTAGGLVSFYAAPIAPISGLGFIAPIGVMLATGYTLVLLPALLAVVPLSASAPIPQEKNLVLRRLLSACGDISIRYPWGVVGASALILGLALGGASQLYFSQDHLRWFPKDEPLRQATTLIDQELKGAMSVEVVVKTGVENGLHEPTLLHKLDEISASIQSIRNGGLFVGKATSVLDVVKETHQALNENRPDFYVIPDSRKLIAQELLLFENSGSDDLEELVDTQFRKARVTLKVPWVDAMLYPSFLASVENRFASYLQDGVGVEVTGISAVFGRMSSSLIVTMGRSYLIAVMIITPLMILLLGSFRRGFLSMIPNLAPIIVILGIMGWLDIPLDITSLMVGGIIIGLAVDDTIHFMHQFNRRYQETGDPQRAIRDTLQATGSAMLFTSVVLSAGFFVFTLAYMENVSTFGALSGLATIVAFFADVTLAPAMMYLVTRRRAEALGVMDVENRPALGEEGPSG
jgi:predicted RND superfamily exporter protein